MDDQSEKGTRTRERRREGGVVVVREDDPETGETIVRRYPTPERDHEADS
jgi:hypothetical protein